MRRRAMRRAEAWLLERLNGEDGLGAIFPAMVNALEAMVLLGYPADDPRRVTAKRAIEKLLVVRAMQRLLPALRLARLGYRAGRARHAGSRRRQAAARRGARRSTGCSRTAAAMSRATGSAQRPRAAGRRLGVPVRQHALSRSRRHRGGRLGHASARATAASATRIAIERALDWLVGMQSEQRRICRLRRRQHALQPQLHSLCRSRRAARSADERCDGARRHGAGAMSTGRRTAPRSTRAIAYLRSEQEADGSWFGRWGTQLHLRHLVGADGAGAGRHPCGRSGRAARGALAACASERGRRLGREQRQLRTARDLRATTRRQHAVSDGLGAAGADGRGRGATRRWCGAASSICCAPSRADGLWSDPTFTAPGFPRVFYLKYHGYCAYFPLWALAAYRTLHGVRSHSLNGASASSAALAAEARTSGRALVTAHELQPAGRWHPAGGERHWRGRRGRRRPARS